MLQKWNKLAVTVSNSSKISLSLSPGFKHQNMIIFPCSVSELEQKNKMSPSNIGIVFGPALMRPRPTDATVSLSSLVDYPHQARIIEALIVFYDQIFEEPSQDQVAKCSDIRNMKYLYLSSNMSQLLSEHCMHCYRTHLHKDLSPHFK